MRIGSARSCLDNRGLILSFADESGELYSLE